MAQDTKLPTPWRGAMRRILETQSNQIMDPDQFPPWKKVQSLTFEQMGQILIAVSEGKSIINASLEVGTTLIAVMVMRVADKEFGDAMNEAITIRNGMLEERAFDMANTGETEEQESHGLGSFSKRKDSTNMIQFLLKAYLPEKYGVERKEVRAGPLDTPPETIKGPGDRNRIIEKLAERMKARQGEVIEAEAIVMADVNDLL